MIDLESTSGTSNTAATTTKEECLPPTDEPACTLVLHAAPTHRKLGQMRRWFKEDNQGIAIAGTRWLLGEKKREGKRSRSMVIYLARLTRRALRMGWKEFRIEEYKWVWKVKDKADGPILNEHP
ncbi:hypothetical protein L211DRAFT_214728 [Terfezia boudieri ATCC MYA-4762]|uniref:Uncharacterized protein n=1 Tax=Terfezia boudieri ATCC MYA-4762 TaxID=1051890 RepID=A0A3N4LMP1_9PEZI|nr:hypothetical protein L211DRAFT_214728 [Terfezia boudieri ATCC MYA-4762]